MKSNTISEASTAQCKYKNRVYCTNGSPLLSCHDTSWLQEEKYLHRQYFPKMRLDELSWTLRDMCLFTVKHIIIQ